MTTFKFNDVAEAADRVRRVFAEDETMSEPQEQIARKPMTPDEFRVRMQEIEENDDIEYAHSEADDLMCSLLEKLGYGEGVRVFSFMDKWYSKT